MASVNEGIAVLAWGTTTVTGYIVETVQENTTSDSEQISDEDGQIISDIHSFGIRTAVTLSVVPKASTTAPAVGDTFTYTSETHGSQKITVKDIDFSSTNTGATRWSIRGERFPDITIT